MTQCWHKLTNDASTKVWFGNQKPYKGKQLVAFIDSCHAVTEESRVPVEPVEFIIMQVEKHPSPKMETSKEQENETCRNTSGK